MSPHETEALDYPSAHRDRALDLLRRRDALTAALAGAPSVEKLRRRGRWARIICWSIVVLAMLTGIASMTGIVSGNGPVLLNMFFVGAALVALITVVKDNQNSDRNYRLKLALEMTKSQLDMIRDDYTTPEGEAWHSDLIAIEALEPGMREASNKFTLTFATVALVVIGGAFLWLAADMIMS